MSTYKAWTEVNPRQRRSTGRFWARPATGAAVGAADAVAAARPDEAAAEEGAAEEGPRAEEAGAHGGGNCGRGGRRSPVAGGRGRVRARRGARRAEEAGWCRARRALQAAARVGSGRRRSRACGGGARAEEAGRARSGDAAREGSGGRGWGAWEAVEDWEIWLGFCFSFLYVSQFASGPQKMSAGYLCANFVSPASPPFALGIIPVGM